MKNNAPGTHDKDAVPPVLLYKLIVNAEESEMEQSLFLLPTQIRAIRGR